MELSWEQITAQFSELPEPSQRRWTGCLDRVSPPPLMVELSTAHLAIDSFNPRELSEKAAQDAVLGARLLAVANSAKFGLTTPLTSIQRAVVHLGFNLVKSIAISYMLETQFQQLVPGARTHLRYLRQLSAGASVIAHKWAQQAELKDSATAATVTLLSQIGGLLLALDPSQPNETYRGIKSGLDALQFERTTWGVTLPSLSAEQARRWGLPEPIPGLILRLWEPLAHSLPLGEDERLLTVAALSLDLTRYYLDDAAVKPGAVIDLPENLRLKENLVRLKLLDSLIDHWSNARLQRELASAVLEV